MIHLARYPREAVRVVRRFIEEAGGLSVRVYAVGGGGIIFDCINGMAGHHNTQLAIMPYGMRSNFIRAFADSDEKLFKDFSLQCKAPTISTDLLSFGHRYCLNYGSIGLDAGVSMQYRDLVWRFPKLTHQLGDALYLACIPLTIRALVVPNRFYKIAIDGENFDGHYANITIANSGLFGRSKCHAPMAHPADGILDVMLMKNTNKFIKHKVYNDQINGKYYKHPKIITHVRGREIVITTEEPVCSVFDGERDIVTHLEARIAPGALDIVSPAGTGYDVRDELTVPVL